DRSKNYSSLDADESTREIQAPGHGCRAQEAQAGPPPQRARATRRMGTRPNRQPRPGDNRTHNLAAKFPRTIHALQSAGSPLPATPLVPILRPSRLRTALGKSTARYNSEKTRSTIP